MQRSDGAAADYEHALSIMQGICQFKPNDGSLLTTLGAAQYRAGDPGAAIETLTTASILKGGLTADLAFLAMAHHQMGEEPEARSYLEFLRRTLASGATDPIDRALLDEASQMMDE